MNALTMLLRMKVSDNSLIERMIANLPSFFGKHAVDSATYHLNETIEYAIDVIELSEQLVAQVKARDDSGIRETVKELVRVVTDEKRRQNELDPRLTD